MPTLQLIDPTGSTEVTRLHAPRLSDLNGRTIAMLSDDMWQAHRMLPLIKAELELRFDGLRVIPETEFPIGTNAIDAESAADRIVAAGADAVIVGNAA